MSEILWTPAADVRETTAIGRWMAWLEQEGGLHLEDYSDTRRWSVTDPDGFWSSIWEAFHLIGDRPSSVALADGTLPGAPLFPGPR